jgi:hypothetical protein
MRLPLIVVLVTGAAAMVAALVMRPESPTHVVVVSDKDTGEITVSVNGEMRWVVPEWGIPCKPLPPRSWFSGMLSKPKPKPHHCMDPGLIDPIQPRNWDPATSTFGASTGAVTADSFRGRIAP